jgi:hypothetical protein
LSLPVCPWKLMAAHLFFSFYKGEKRIRNLNRRGGRAGMAAAKMQMLCIMFKWFVVDTLSSGIPFATIHRECSNFDGFDCRSRVGDLWLKPAVEFRRPSSTTASARTPATRCNTSTAPPSPDSGPCATSPQPRRTVSMPTTIPSTSLASSAPRQTPTPQGTPTPPTSTASSSPSPAPSTSRPTPPPATSSASSPPSAFRDAGCRRPHPRHPRRPHQNRPGLLGPTPPHAPAGRWLGPHPRRRLPARRRRRRRGRHRRRAGGGGLPRGARRARAASSRPPAAAVAGRSGAGR